VVLLRHDAVDVLVPRLPVQVGVDVAAAHQHERVEPLQQRHRLVVAHLPRREGDRFATGAGDRVEVAAPGKGDRAPRDPPGRGEAPGDGDQRLRLDVHALHCPR
jgi:hypothetical protein